MGKVVLSLSGGLDSVAAWWALNKPDWLFVMGAHPIASGRECQAVAQMCRMDLTFDDCGTVLDIDLLPFMRPDGWSFPRNFLLASLGVGLGYEEIWFAYHAWDGSGGDYNKRTTRLFQDAYGLPNLAIREPTRQWSRTELLDRARAAGCPDEFLLATWSCQRAGELHCGECNNCVERYVSLRAHGIDPGFELHNASDATAYIKTLGPQGATASGTTASLLVTAPR